MPTKSTAYHKSKTAASAIAFQVDTNLENELTSVNFHCYLFDVYYGNAAGQEGIIRANAVVWFDGTIIVSDWWFKNVVGASNGKVVIIGVLKKG